MPLLGFGKFCPICGTGGFDDECAEAGYSPAGLVHEGEGVFALGIEGTERGLGVLMQLGGGVSGGEGVDFTKKVRIIDLGEADIVAPVSEELAVVFIGEAFFDGDDDAAAAAFEVGFKV